MKLTILGASGGVGRELVTQAVERGHAVRAVVRRPTAFPAGVETSVVEDVTDVKQIAPLIADAQVVLSALGLRRRHASNPWSRIVSPIDLTSRFAAALVEAIREKGISPRVIVVSAAGVGESRPRMSGLLRWMFDHSNVGVAYADLDRMENVLRESPLDWIAARPVTLNHRQRSGKVREVEYYGATAQVSRADVAWWMLEQAQKNRIATRTPMIAS